MEARRWRRWYRLDLSSFMPGDGRCGSPASSPIGNSRLYRPVMWMPPFVVESSMRLPPPFSCPSSLRRLFSPV